MKRLRLLFLTLLTSLSLQSQPPPDHRWVEVIVAPDKPDWTYEIGEEVTFDVTVLKSNVPLRNAQINYEIGPEKMEAVKKGGATLKEGKLELKGYGMKEPGFLRCTVTAEFEGKKYTSWATAGFSPAQISPTVEQPASFRSYWQQAVSENNKLPMDVKMTMLTERCTETVNVYHVSLQNWKPGGEMWVLPKTASSVLKLASMAFR